MKPTKHQKKSTIIIQILKKKSTKALKHAKKTILAEKIEYKQLREALEYYVLNWTEFTHPGLLAIACEAVDGNLDKTIPIQAAILDLTAAFDIHDDIIDKSEIKHGKLTVVGKFGKDIALLLGNAFMVKGFTLLGKATEDLTDDQTEDIFVTLEKSLFESGNAHALELSLKGKMNIDPQEYFRILQTKASSIKADMRIGAIVGGGTKNQVDILTKYGEILGVLAVLREEFVDIFELEEVRQRFKSECLPIPILYAMQDQKSKREIGRILTNKQITSEDATELLNIIFESKGVHELRRIMEDLITEACQLLSGLESAKPKVLLNTLVEAILEDL
jgi:geranylgeranyl pyrophosphate synthase